ncbi:MAG: sporulation protein YtfJ [Firmicutes bacterium]|nr:sporulation protein YtfJ [Bacillota bacterium]HXL05047.1 GerW family sporulation protein [Bacillota bacterium]
MADHPIDALMRTAMANIKEMIDVNTILGDPVETADGTVILPVSRVSVGFAAGGSEFPTARERQEGKTRPNDATHGAEFPFGGGAGAGLTILPVAFLVVSMGQVRVMPVEGIGPLDKLIDFVPSFLAKGAPGAKQKSTGDIAYKQNIQGDAH